jgi:uncharacterized protein YjiS (DUF1127 family)
MREDETANGTRVSLMSFSNKIAGAAGTTGLDQWRRRWSSGWLRLESGLERWRQRRLLLTLDDRMLKDIGLSRCDAEREAAKRWRP